LNAGKNLAEEDQEPTDAVENLRRHVPFCNKNTRKLHDIKLEIWKQSKTSLHLVVVFAVVIVRSRSLHKTGDLQVGN